MQEAIKHPMEIQANLQRWFEAEMRESVGSFDVLRVMLCLPINAMISVFGKARTEAELRAIMKTISEGDGYVHLVTIDDVPPAGTA